VKNYHQKKKSKNSIQQFANDREKKRIPTITTGRGEQKKIQHTYIKTTIPLAAWPLSPCPFPPPPLTSTTTTSTTTTTTTTTTSIHKKSTKKTEGGQ